MAVELYHPELKTTHVFTDEQAPHFIREGGWLPVDDKEKKKKGKDTDGKS